MKNDYAIELLTPCLPRRHLIPSLVILAHLLIPILPHTVWAEGADQGHFRGVRLVLRDGTMASGYIHEFDIYTNLSRPILQRLQTSRNKITLIPELYSRAYSGVTSFLVADERHTMNIEPSDIQAAVPILLPYDGTPTSAGSYAVMPFAAIRLLSQKPLSEYRYPAPTPNSDGYWIASYRDPLPPTRLQELIRKIRAEDPAQRRKHVQRLLKQYIVVINEPDVD